MDMNGIARLIVDSSDRSSDLRYACAFRTTGDAVVFLHHRGRSRLVAPLMERAHAEAAMGVSGGIVMTPSDLGLPVTDRSRVSAWACGLLRKTGIREVAVARSFPVSVADDLKRRRIRVHVVDGCLFPEREIKSRLELKYCAASQKAAIGAMRLAARLIRAASIDSKGRLIDGGRVLCSEKLRDCIEVFLFEHQCVGDGTIVSCGADSALPHHRGAGALFAGCPIIIDIFPRHRQHGYHGDLTRTLVRGPVPARLRRMLQAVSAAQQAALRKVHAGVAASTVHNAARQVFERLGMETDLGSRPPRGFIHSTGHGVGLDVHEAPAIGGAKNRLRAGQVVTIEPGWYEPGFGGVRVEDTVAVTRNGYDLLGK